MNVPKCPIGGPPTKEKRLRFSAIRAGSFGLNLQSGVNGMGALTRELYSSPNGDRWLLAREPESGHVFVQHQPNLASGGKPSEIEIGAFLLRGAQGPEHQALLHLIGSLVEPQTASPPPLQPKMCDVGS